MKIRIGIVTLLSAVLVLASGAQSADYDKVKKERKALMKSLSKENKALKKAAKGLDPVATEMLARTLASGFANIANPCLFPRGSGPGSRSKPAVWENWPDFEEKSKNARKLALLIAAQAKAGNMGEASNLAGKLGKQTCSSCHKLYRAKKKKKK